MGDAYLITHAKKWKNESDYQSCIICQQKQPTEALVANPKPDSIENVFNLSRELHKYGDTAVVEFV